MRLFINSPLRLQLQAVLERLGEPAPVVVLPAGAGSLLLRLPGNPSIGEWHRFWQQVLGGQVPLAELSPAHVATCAEVCADILTESSYFGKVRRSPRFHLQLCARFVEWRRDGLTPERLGQAAPMVARPPFESLAGIERDALRAEWLRKVEELCALWQEWEQRLQRRSLAHPGVCWWEAVEVVRRGQVELPPRLLLTGFHDLHEVDIALLHAASQRGCDICLTLPYEAHHPLIARLQPYLSALSDLSDMSDESDGAAGASTTVVVLSVPDPLREVEVVARHILHHLQRGVPPEQIALVLRQPAAALERLTRLFERYGIPLALEIHLPLSHSPLVRVLLNALRLLLGQGTGADWLEWLQNPYLGWSREGRYRLSQVGKRALPADVWLDEARRCLAAESSFAPTPAVPVNEAGVVLARLADYRDQLRQPSPDLHAVIKSLREWLEPSPGDIEARNELTATSKLQELVRAYMPLLQRMPIARAVASIARLCDVELYPHLLGRDGVRVVPLEFAGLIQAEVVFLMEMVEGVLPRRHPDDPFLRESERRALRAYFENQGERVYLPLRSERQRVEPLLFAAAMAAAAPYLYLSCPRVIDESETLPSSYLQQLPPHETRFYRLEDLIPPEHERLHPYDRAMAHAAQLGAADSSDLSGASDRLTLPSTRQQVMDIDRTFSVSELETLYRCPFQYLFRHRLRVRVPRRGLHLTQVGSVLHATLRHAYRHHRALPPDSPEWAQALLASLARVLDETPPELAHWQLQVLHAYATRLLQLFALREPRYRQQFGLEPRHFEWAFGTPISSDEENPLPDGAADRPDWFDPDSERRAYRLSLGGGSSIRLSGVMDRIDVSPISKVAMITDYKLTHSPRRVDIEAGVAFQPLLYAMVVQARFGAERVVIAFDELSHGRRVRFVPYDEGLIRRFRAGEWEGSPAEVMMVLSQTRMVQAIQRLREELHHLLTLLQQATVHPTPGEHCRLCAFGDLCRRAQR
jgi:RecB family exonuclease